MKHQNNIIQRKSNFSATFNQLDHVLITLFTCLMFFVFISTADITKIKPDIYMLIIINFLIFACLGSYILVATFLLNLKRSKTTLEIVILFICYLISGLLVIGVTRWH
jgi:O-antigen ligase